MLGKRNREQLKLRKPPDDKANLYGCEMQWTERKLLSNIPISTNLTHEEFKIRRVHVESTHRFQRGRKVGWMASSTLLLGRGAHKRAQVRRNTFCNQ